MAFYSKSVNDITVEIERPKLSTESQRQSCRTSNTISDVASTNSQHESSLGGIYSRYSAVSYEKTDTSMESLNDLDPTLMPPLDLHSSGETMPSTDSAPCGLSFTIDKACEANRISQSNAFYNWLSSKKNLKSYEQAKQKKLEEEREQQLKERKELAEQKYKAWLAKKSRQSLKEKPKSSLPTQLQEYQEQNVCQDLPANESNRRAWEKKKLEEQRQKREELLKIKEKQKLIEEQRRKAAARAWQSWIAEAPLKPKPVPLNKGFLTLKGTISDIYVNPNPWREPFEVVDGE